MAAAAAARDDVRTEYISSLSGSHRLAAVIRERPGTNWLIFCHGLGAHKNMSMFRELAPRAPYNTVAFDFRCNGESSGGAEDWSLGGYAEEAFDDLEGVKHWIRTQRRGRVLALCGHSRGANVVLMNAARFDDVDYVIVLAGRYDMAGGLEPYFRPGDRAKLERGETHLVACAKPFPDGVPRFISSKDLKKRLDIHPEQIRTALRQTRRVFVIHGDADTVIPAADAEKLAAASPEGKGWLKILPGADHSLRVDKTFDALGSALQEVYAIMEADFY